MAFFKSYITLLRRSPLVRISSWILIIVLSIFLFGILSRNVRKKPVIASISPMIGSPGDEMIIEGSNFGETRENSSVEIAGSKVTSSGYTFWSDRKIRLVIPQNVQDGLVTVATAAGVSEPAFFANENDIPVAASISPATALPSIASVSAETAVVGQVIEIRGANFGNSRGASKVYFTANRDETSAIHGSEQNEKPEKNNLFISASETDFDYITWTDSEIAVRIPDGAATGPFFIETVHGTSAAKKITVSFPYGKKQYANQRTYVIQVAADISNHISSQESSILLYIPKPAVSSFQPFVELNEVYPEPFIIDDNFNVIHNKPLNQILNNKQRFSQTFIVSVFSVKGNYNPKNSGQYKEKTGLLYTKNTVADGCVPSDAKAVSTLMEVIVGNEKNPYRQARLIYDFMTSKYEISEKIRTGNISPLDLIRRKTGDAYDFAILYTALCRAAGIPAVPVAGILAHDKSTVAPHWWTELYFEGYGWLPVDVSLGAGLAFAPFIEIEDPGEFYFGNIDNQHIAFSRGWHQIKQSSIDSKIVYRPRTYALQSLWEEAGDKTSSYSSLWNNPVIQGIY
ncbi:transglutaminase domain-containing protein [Treponema sp.]|uniref:transglutaminase domain-containing protein n=1 Tax=Treponema sp. TaxID=166 RepID=UPI003F030DE5